MENNKTEELKESTDATNSNKRKRTENNLKENVKSGDIVKSGDSIIVTEEKSFSYEIETEYSRFEFTKTYQKYYCYDCQCYINAIIFDSSERDYGRLYSHLERNHGVICIESTKDNVANKLTQIKYKKIVKII